MTGEEQAWSVSSVADESRFDAIVVGSGASGGVAATRLCEAGMKVAVFEAGLPQPRRVHPITASLSSFARLLDKVEAQRRLPHSIARIGERAFRLMGRVRQPVQSKCFAWAMAPDMLVDDIDCPYQTEQGSKFLWYRARQPGGRMLVPGHGRLYFRLAGMTRAATDGCGAGWPIGLADLDEWYGWVEDRLQLKGGTGNATGPALSRSVALLPPTSSEHAVMDAIRAGWPSAQPALGSFAAPLAWLDQAAATGHLTCQTGAVVRRVIRGATGAAEGIEWIDSRSGAVKKAFAPVVFLCASTIESTRILLLSRVDNHNTGHGIGSPVLGTGLMDHAVISALGFRSDLADIAPLQSEPGRCIYVPPGTCTHPSVGTQIYLFAQPGGGAGVRVVSFAEMQPDAWNRVTLHPSRRDRYGMPVAVIRFKHSEEQIATARRQTDIIRELAGHLNLTHVTMDTSLSPGGASIHECGTARMGDDPATSVVSPENECWDAPGLYVTDGACFPRQYVHNPTLTIMALTARAAAHAAAR